MDSLNWGKCVIGALWQEPEDTAAKLLIFPVAAEDTTELTTTEGDEVEATVEGGEVEAVRYTANKYNLTAALRTLSSRLKPMRDKNGKLTGSGSVFLIPEDVNSDLGIYMEKVNGKMVDSFTAADGGRFVYTFKALKATSGNMCKWGTFTITDTDSKSITDIDDVVSTNISSIKFKEIQTEGQTAPTEISLYTKSA